ncbi:hypothetical protein APR03_004648 [Promicromonospora thailandica]|uniref:Uncharacterized protein n=1 Tax=Promicromonospora thailandica TaxID=765201 RepID=A0A9X2G7Z3_9MICO|nr:hypothetical protein [Promicromonospora thailandica]
MLQDNVRNLMARSGDAPFGSVQVILYNEDTAVNTRNQGS